MPFWHLDATVYVRNIGNSRAFIIGTASHFFVVRTLKDIDLDALRISSLTLDDDILDPTKEPICSRIHFFPGQSEDNFAEFADGFFEGKIKLLIVGFIEYETMGTKWHRDFGFIRESSKGGLWSMLGNPAPDTPEEKLARGYWSKYSGYPNEEYEVVSQDAI